MAVQPIPIYLDHNATAPAHPAAVTAWLEATRSLWHNPSSLTPDASRAREAIERARETLGDVLDCDPGRIVFTSGATESANAIARHLAASPPTQQNPSLALVSPIEHSSVADAFSAELGGRLRSIEVDTNGIVSPECVAMTIDHAFADGSTVGIVSVMAASNESGVLEPWQAIARICRERRVPFHTDATQWLGRLPARGLGECDWVSASGHKCGGPRGVGFIVVPEGLRFQVAFGGPQEHGRRAGTEDTAGILALVAAIVAREEETASTREVRASFRDAAERRLLDRLPAAMIVSGSAQRLWNTLALVLPGQDGRRIVSRLAAAGVAASTGSACSAGAGSTPAILSAIGHDRLGLAAKDLRGMVRLSAGWETTAEDWIAAIDILVKVAGGDVSLPSVDLGGLSRGSGSTVGHES